VGGKVDFGGGPFLLLPATRGPATTGGTSLRERAHAHRTRTGGLGRKHEWTTMTSLSPERRKENMEKRKKKGEKGKRRKRREED